MIPAIMWVLAVVGYSTLCVILWDRARIAGWEKGFEEGYQLAKKHGSETLTQAITTANIQGRFEMMREINLRMLQDIEAAALMADDDPQVH